MRWREALETDEGRGLRGHERGLDGQLYTLESRPYSIEPRLVNLDSFACGQRLEGV